LTCTYSRRTFVDMMHPADKRSRNPRIQCDSCGKWSRLHRKDGSQFSYGGCAVNDGNDHNAAGARMDVCDECCKAKCHKEAR